MRLGRKKYKVLRSIESYYTPTGVYVRGGDTEVEITANIQGALYWNGVRFSDAGEISKRAISIRSNQPLFQAQSGRKADIVIYENARWEVRDVRHYNNLRKMVHWEAMAVIMDESKVDRSYGNDD